MPYFIQYKVNVSDIGYSKTKNFILTNQLNTHSE